MLWLWLWLSWEGRAIFLFEVCEFGLVDMYVIYGIETGGCVVVFMS